MAEPTAAAQTAIGIKKYYPFFLFVVGNNFSHVVVTSFPYLLFFLGFLFRPVDFAGQNHVFFFFLNVTGTNSKSDKTTRILRMAKFCRMMKANNNNLWA